MKRNKNMYFSLENIIIVQISMMDFIQLLKLTATLQTEPKKPKLWLFIMYAYHFTWSGLQLLPLL